MASLTYDTGAPFNSVMVKPDDPSRTRLLAAAKQLFAELGYENTQTAAIARKAKTSESQLVRYFSGKAGLLDSIFEAAWQPLNIRVHQLETEGRDSRETLLETLTAVLSALNRDQELAVLFLFEGRRIRAGSHDVRLSEGFVEFSASIHRLIKRGQKAGTFASDLDATAVATALTGAVEAMVRERVIAIRTGATRRISKGQLQRVVSAMLDGFTG